MLKTYKQRAYNREITIGLSRSGTSPYYKLSAITMVV
jgi:hypothetical protein